MSNIKHQCEFCGNYFYSDNQLHPAARAFNLRQRIKRLEGLSTAEVMREQAQIFEAKRTPKGKEPPQTGDTCAGCKDDMVVLVAINGLLMTSAIEQKPDDPQKAIEGIMDELLQKLPPSTYDLH